VLYDRTSPTNLRVNGGNGRISIDNQAKLLIASLVPVTLDDVDVAIVRLLQADGRMSNAEIARRVQLSPPAVHARVKRLEDSGVVRGYTAVLDRELTGFDMVCFISVSLQLHQFEAVERFRELVQEMPEVLECHHITGEFDYLLKAVFRNRRELQRFIVNRLTPIPGMARINTSLVLIEIKANTPLPIEEEREDHE
jgi:DNA-binding Lrp family transcriptional regulator